VRGGFRWGAELAGLSLREFLHELRSRRVPLNYDLEELEKDMKTMMTLIEGGRG